MFFARKFEPIISQKPLDIIDAWISTGKANNGFSGKESYWQNAYHHLDDTPAPRNEFISLGKVLADLCLERNSGLKSSGYQFKELR